MRITRINKRPNDNPEPYKKEKRPYRKIKRLVKESTLEHITDTTNIFNAPGVFSYSDVNRNAGAINLIKHQIDQAITNFGVDLVYFRKYNTFFKEGEENTSNMIYGEDTVAEYYVSGVMRAFVSVDNMAWNFNQLGLESVEQIMIYVTIQRFEQAFANKIGQVETKHFEVPMSGNIINNEAVGKIVEPEFQADVYATFDDSLNVKDTVIKMVPKEVNQSFYLTNTYNSSLYPISGSLHGKLKHDKEKALIVYGLLEGDLSYHNLKNIEDSSTWGLAPQVGDYFSFKTPTGISEEWEISNVYDRNLTKSGLNPLLGKYVFQISAVKRVRSHEKNTEDLNYREPGEDINDILGNISRQDPAEQFSNNYTYKKGKNVQNKITNKLAKNAFDYVDKSDLEYGGVQTEPKAK